MSALSQKTLGVLKNKFLWQNAFCQSATKAEGHVEESVSRAHLIASSLGDTQSSRGGHSMLYTSATATAAPHNAPPILAQELDQNGKNAIKKDKLFDAKGTGECLCLCAQLAKMDIFGRYCARKYGGQVSEVAGDLTVNMEI
eukprot:GDKK01007998.1.p1 GENE.GDKK01007998.1~~GDKK01007998.1.p1  ORF type:complete len:157 (-),score=11.07 GDKK01007998.1:119-544(-)